MLAKNEGYGKLQARARDRGRCVVCGYDIVVDVHHIVPRSAGGGNQLSNLITVCPNHHAMAHRGLLSRDEMLALLAASLS